MSVPYFIIIAVTVVIVALGSAVTSLNMQWYEQLSLPSWIPSRSVIGIVWTMLYILIALSVVVTYRYTWERARRRILMWLFGVNAFLYIGWTITFFRFHAIGWAVFVAVLLEISILAIIAILYPYRRMPALLLVPYGFWVAFATYLNWVVWRMN